MTTENAAWCCANAAAPSGIARRGVEFGERLGHRWVVERTVAGLNRFRRLRVRYERRDDIHVAFTKLACAHITFRAVKRVF